MSCVNLNIPPQEVFVRGQFLRGHKDCHEQKFRCSLFGFSSIINQAPTFHFLMEDGGLWSRMPLHAFCWQKDAGIMELHEIVEYDCFSNYASVIQYNVLQNKKVRLLNKDMLGTYCFTIDWHHADPNVPNTYFSETPLGSCAHFIKLDNGNFAMQPNHTILIDDKNSLTPEIDNFPLITRLNSVDISSAENSLLE